MYDRINPYNFNVLPFVNADEYLMQYILTN